MVMESEKSSGSIKDEQDSPSSEGLYLPPSYEDVQTGDFPVVLAVRHINEDDYQQQPEIFEFEAPAEKENLIGNPLRFNFTLY